MNRQASSAVNKKYEKLLREVGDFGRYQKILLLWLILSTVPNGYQALMMVFLGRTPPTYRCIVPDMGNTTSGNISSGALHNVTVETPMEHCSNSAGENSTSTVNSCTNGIVYEGFDEGRTTLVTEWDLVCDRAWILPLITMTQMSGWGVGSIIGGPTADRFGRYPVFIISTILMFVLGGLLGVATSPVVFSTLIFFCAATTYVTTSSAFVLSAEIINTKDRAVTGTLTIGGFTLGTMLLPLACYFIVSWRHLCYIFSIAGVLFIPYIWLLDESPRWLFSQGRKDDFIKVFMKIAKTNKVEEYRARKLLTNFYNEVTEVSKESSSLIQEEQMAKHDGSNPNYSYLDLLRYREVRLKTICTWFIWFVCSLVYYGVALNTSDMGGDPYVNCFVAAAVEIPAYTAVVLLLKWRGRKPVTSCGFIIAGIACSLPPYLKKVNIHLAIAFAMMGKLAVAGAFMVLFISCAELYPTLMRGMGLGSASFAARIGGMAAPYMLFLGHFYKEAPYIIMGVMAIAAAVVNLLLPETGNVPLPETIQDLKPMTCFLRFGRSKQVKMADSVY